MFVIRDYQWKANKTISKSSNSTRTPEGGGGGGGGVLPIEARRRGSKGGHSRLELQRSEV